MTAIGGSIQSVSLDGRSFSVSADSDGSRKIGGFENESQPNGDGTTRLIKTRVPLSIADLVLEIDDSAADQEFLQNLADGTDYFPIALVLASGETWQGSAQIDGEINASTQNATATLSLSGPGKLTRQ